MEQEVVYDGSIYRYSLRQNGYGHYWPILEVFNSWSASWGEIIIRDSNPFKTKANAIKFIEKHKASYWSSNTADR